MANMNIFDDKNIFDDDFDLLSESAESLFGNSINKASDIKTENNEKINNELKENKKEINAKNAEKSPENLEEKSPQQIENKENEPLNVNNLHNNKKDNNIQEKTKKNKKNKTKKNNKNNVKILSENATHSSTTEKQKKQIGKMTIFAICIFVLVAVASVSFLVLYLKQINTKLNVPECSVVQLESGTIINIDKVKNAVAYEICITKQDLDNPISFKSENNIIELKSFLNQPGQFNIKVRAIGKTNNATSDYSESISITNYIKLKTPKVFKDGTMLSWNPVEKATKYKLFYRADLEEDTIDFIELEQNETLITFDLENLHQFGPGLYPICVQAIYSGAQYYLDGNFSETINYEYYAQLQEVAYSTLNCTSKTIKFILYKQAYIPTQFKLSVLNGDYTKDDFIIYTDELIGQEIKYNDEDAIMFSASLLDVMSDDIISASLVSLANNIYATNSSIIDVVLEY